MVTSGNSIRDGGKRGTGFRDGNRLQIWKHFAIVTITTATGIADRWAIRRPSEWWCPVAWYCVFAGQCIGWFDVGYPTVGGDAIFR